MINNAYHDQHWKGSEPSNLMQFRVQKLEKKIEWVLLKTERKLKSGYPSAWSRFTNGYRKRKIEEERDLWVWLWRTRIALSLVQQMAPLFLSLFLSSKLPCECMCTHFVYSFSLSSFSCSAFWLLAQAFCYLKICENFGSLWFLNLNFVEMDIMMKMNMFFNVTHFVCFFHFGICNLDRQWLYLPYLHCNFY